MKMTNEIRIKFAEAEGYEHRQSVEDNAFPYGDTVTINLWWKDGVSYRAHCLPTYDNDSDLDRVIRGMDEKSFPVYAEELWVICDCDCDSMLELKATEEQKQEAIVKAMGWGEST